MSECWTVLAKGKCWAGNFIGEIFCVSCFCEFEKLSAINLFVGILRAQKFFFQVIFVLKKLGARNC
jgi:hypothetical protein